MDDLHTHWYELTMLPTPAQEAELSALLSTAGGSVLAARDLVEPLAPGWLAVRGVTGALRVATDWDRQLPPWAQVVLGREYASGGRSLPFPALWSARRVPWAEIRREQYGWTLDLAFCWAAFQDWQLSCGVNTGGGGELTILMGDGSQKVWPSERRDGPPNQG